MGKTAFDDFDDEAGPSESVEESPKPKRRPNSRDKMYGGIEDDIEVDDLGSGLGDGFSVERAKKAKGNYLITVGYPTSGKSTFHSMLLSSVRESIIWSM